MFFLISNLAAIILIFIGFILFLIAFLKRSYRKVNFIINILMIIFFFVLFINSLGILGKGVSPRIGITQFTDKLGQESLNIVVAYPSPMQVHHSYVIKADLIPQGESVISNIPIEKATAISIKATPVGTPNITLKNAFGSQYKANAYATLSPNNGPFQITSIPPLEQSLDQSQVEWKWTIVPLQVGTQILDLNIEANWKSAKGVVEGPFRIGDDQMSVDVTSSIPSSEPFITLGQISIGELASQLIATILSAGGLGTIFIVGFTKWVVNELKEKKSISSKITKRRVKRKKR